MEISSNVQPLQSCRWQRSAVQGTAGGTNVADTWTDITFSGAAGDSDFFSQVGAVISLIAGTYVVMAKQVTYVTNHCRLRVYNSTDTAEIARGPNNNTGTANIGVQEMSVMATFTITETKGIKIQYYCVDAQATDGLGRAINIASENENYAELLIMKIR